MERGAQVNIGLALTFGIPSLLQGYVIGLLTMMFGFTHKPRFDGPVLVTDWRPWFSERWAYCTTIAAWQGRPPWFNEWTRYHENIHLKQFIDMNVLGAFLAAALAYPLGWWAFAVWGSSGALWYAPGYLAAIVRYKRPGVSWLDAAYYASVLEEHAYSATKAKQDGHHDRWEL